MWPFKKRPPPDYCACTEEQKAKRYEVAPFPEIPQPRKAMDFDPVSFTTREVEIRDDDYWMRLDHWETMMRWRSMFDHKDAGHFMLILNGICPDCSKYVDARAEKSHRRRFA